MRTTSRRFDRMKLLFYAALGTTMVLLFLTINWYKHQEPEVSTKREYLHEFIDGECIFYTIDVKTEVVSGRFPTINTMVSRDTTTYIGKGICLYHLFHE